MLGRFGGGLGDMFGDSESASDCFRDGLWSLTHLQEAYAHIERTVAVVVPNVIMFGVLNS